MGPGVNSLCIMVIASVTNMANEALWCGCFLIEVVQMCVCGGGGLLHLLRSQFYYKSKTTPSKNFKKESCQNQKAVVSAGFNQE